MYEFKLADLGEGIHEAEILKWHAAAGDRIEQDADLVDLETDKAAVTVPSPVAGTLRELAGGVGDLVEVGQVIAVIDDGSGDAVAPPPDAAQNAKASAPATATPAAPVSSAAPTAGGPVPAAPATRRLARELGVDLKAVTATGPGGRVTPEDVQRLAAGGGAPPVAPTTAPKPTTPRAPVDIPAGSGLPLVDFEALPDFSGYGPVEIEPLRSIRRKVARKMATASALAAQVSHLDEADITELEAFRQAERAKRASPDGANITALAFMVKAVVTGLKRWRMFNASLDPFREEIVYKGYYNIGVAVDSGKGLIVPVIHNADQLSIVEIAARIADLAGRARENKLTVPELQGGSFTISNIGGLGGFSPNPIVNYPEVAILGMGRAKDKPVVIDGEVAVRRMLPLALSFDHRVADGGDSARFVNQLVGWLEDPRSLLVEL